MRICIPILFLFTLTSLGLYGQETNKPIRLDLFRKIPAQIDGCNGLYTYDSISLKKKTYIVAIDLEDLAFISVGSKIISLKRISHKELSNKVFEYIYKGSGYKITLKTKVVKEIGEEVSLDAGTVEIYDGKSKIILKIHGEVGC